MAAPAQQPEMADLSSAVLPGQSTPSTAREGEGASTLPEGKATVQSALDQGTNGESKPTTTDTADMHTLAPISHADGTVRGANNEVGGNTDKATVADSDHAYAIAKTEDTAAALPPQSENKPPSISKHAAPVTISTIGGATESQEKGSQIVLELVRKAVNALSIAVISEM